MKQDWSEPLEMCQSILSSQNKSDKLFNDAKAWRITNPHNDTSMAHLLSNCTNFLNLVPFANAPASEEEAEFPLAYVLIGARNAAQTVRFLRMIYQPQNAYCLTYDKKSSMDYQTVITQLANCFSDNVVLSPEPEVIYWSHHSILHQIILCMKEL